MKYIRLFALGLALLGCGGETKKAEGWEVTIRGKVNFPKPGIILLTEMRQGESAAVPRQDTIALNPDNTFEKKVRIKSPGYYQLDFFKPRWSMSSLTSLNLQWKWTVTVLAGPQSIGLTGYRPHRAHSNIDAGGAAVNGGEKH